MVACLSADPASAKPAATCTAKDADDKKFKYTLNTVDYTLTFVEATTGSQLGGRTEDLRVVEPPARPSCSSQRESDYYVSPDNDVLEPAIDDFVG